MKELIFLLADAWMIFTGFFYGWKFIRRYGNYLLGLEWMVVGTSGTNFLFWALLGGDEDSPLYFLAYFFDAFSRSVGITLIVVMGLMRVTHHYKPSLTADVGVFALAGAAGLYLQQFHHEFHAGAASFYVVVNALTAVFLAYFVWRLWAIGAKGWASAAAAAVTAGLVVTVTYDFFPIPYDDAHRTTFYTLALATWGTQMFVFFHAYRALHDRDATAGIGLMAHERSVARS
ncbi:MULTISPECIES: transporter [unclassified Streptomyces]|uniref:transporter n=1 Tax=Streptomyces sp. NPDC127129 TaxID=3345373 RepID=UPI00363E2BE5